MRLRNFLMQAVALIAVAIIPAFAQKAPDLENGFKNYGSYDGSHLDTVNLMNGNLTLHAPLLPSYPQRGKFSLQDILAFNSKTWEVVCRDLPFNGGTTCGWFYGGTGVSLQRSIDLAIQRTDDQFNSGIGVQTYTANGYSITSPDGAAHQLMVTASGTASPMEMESVDTSGYHVVMSGADENGVPNTATITDRHGNQYLARFASWGNSGGDCGGQLPMNHLPPARIGGGLVEPIIDDAPMGDRYCPQIQGAYKVTDSNGNFLSLFDPATLIPGVDTLGRALPLETGTVASDNSGCLTTSATYSPYLVNYNAPDGTTRQMKLCFVDIPFQTAFNITLGGTPVTEGYGKGFIGPTPPQAPNVLPTVSAVILADGTKWTFTYDGYGEITRVTLPSGGSISYTWTTINLANGCSGSFTHWSRAVATRTLDDGQGHTYEWLYTWDVPANGVVSNLVTDPLNNDTAHVFTALDGSSGCAFYETSTQYYQGTKSPAHLLKQINTTYYPPLPFLTYSGESAPGNVVPKDITTTVFPSRKVSRIHREYDTGLGTGKPIFGNVKKELQYDWGQGAPGPLLRETDTIYQWEINPAYLAAGLLDLPASVIVKDGSSNRVAETDYAYDKAGYLATSTPAITTQHNSTAPYSVRGNQTTVSHWLNTANSFVSSHTKWYDTGEVYQQIDPLGHTTTYSYDPFYAGAYVTGACSPSTSGIAHCVSGTYDLNTGVLTSLTNENATTQASGNTSGDAAHTSSFSYDHLFRITSAQAPPDPANNGLRAQTNFNFSTPNSFPLSVQRTKSVTTSLNDSATNFFDGLGRAYKGQHALPNGTATVDTTFDLAGHPATVSNPYFSTSDPTYGLISSQYDALDRVTQTTKQDGSISRMQYSVATTMAVNGDCTIATDEAGKQRGACTDALGRLVEVDEPNSAAMASANYHLTMQSDGNFVLSNSSNVALWQTGTNAGVLVEMQDNGNLVLYHQLWQTGTYRAPSGGTAPYDACRIGNLLTSGQVLHENQCLESNSGMTFALMTNGDLQIYDRQLGQITWHSNTYGHPGSYAVLQSDGKFVIYDANNNYLWAGWTFGASLVELEDDGRLIIYDSVWSSGTSQSTGSTIYSHPACDAGVGTGWTGVLGTGQCFVSRSGRFELLLQTDGNLVIYDRSVTPNSAIWSTGTTVSPADPGFALRTLYSYDALGNFTCVEQHGDVSLGTPGATGCSADPQNDAASPWRVRRFTYDSLSRLSTAKNPESGTISYTYDPDGELLMKTSPAPDQTNPAVTQTISYCYDELHRVTKRDYQSHAFTPQNCPITAPIVGYVYDTDTNAKGHLVLMSDQAGTATYGYDILGRLATETRSLTGANDAAISKTVSYEYNLDGSSKSLHYPSGAIIAYTPDSAGRALSAVDAANGTNYVTGATYGPDSSLTGFVSGSGGPASIASSFSYSKRLQPVNMSASAASQTVFSIGYDFHAGNGIAGSGTDNGNVWGIYNYRDRNRDQTFTYDALNRLVAAQNAGTNCSVKTLNPNQAAYWGNSYSYDAWGNLLGKSVTKCGAENLSVTADAHNWIHASGTDYQYDAAGNMTFNATPPTQTYTWDPENRLMGAAGYIYTYDGDGNRVRKSNGNTASSGTLYWYMTPGVIAESDLAGSLISEYVFFDDERVARKDFPGNAVAYYFSDHLKTASVITDSVGTIKAESDYYPWGGELQFVSNDSNDYKFTGKKRDAETSLDYFGARYYSNGLGRWISSDWSAAPVPVPYANFDDPQSLNLYGFVGSNPASKGDPDGHCCTEVLEELRELVDSGTAEGQQMIQSAKFGPAIPGVLGGLLLKAGLNIQADINYAKADKAHQDVVQSNLEATRDQYVREYGNKGETHASEDKPDLAPAAGGAGARGPIKAKDAPGVTAGGQATDKHGNKLTGSGRVQVNITRSNTREQAGNRALKEGSGKVEHRTPKAGNRHFHATDNAGNKKPGSTHHEF
jgi:RHS repeat-associated protein